MVWPCTLSNRRLFLTDCDVIMLVRADLESMKCIIHCIHSVLTLIKLKNIVRLTSGNKLCMDDTLFTSELSFAKT